MPEQMIPTPRSTGGAAQGFPSHTLPTSQPDARITSWANLLEQFYAQSGHSFPGVQPLEASQLPEPYRGLLAHAADMTPTLEKFYARPLGITVLNYKLQSDSYLREVVLNLAGEPTPTDGARAVEYGVIRIFLNRLPAVARGRVLEQQKPFGSILRDEAIPHTSWPQSFFRVESDARLGSLLRIRPARQLYGRRNILLDGSRHALAEVIEILAPVDPAAPTG